MDELVERVRQALAAEYPGAPNGRVRDVPDRRAIRWYTTTGLVDRPGGMRGRTNLYGPRHLLQVVAVKRRQAEGHSLAAIQAELAGASDAELAIAARVPDELLAPESTPDPGADAAEAADEPARTRFWATSTTPATPLAPATAEATAPSARPIGLRPVPDQADATARELGSLALGGGAILVLPVRPAPGDHADIADAARPLLDLLAARGLLTFEHLDDGSA